jgi:flavin-dependent dehydrogenase
MRPFWAGPISSYRFDFNRVVLTGTPPPFEEEVSLAYGPRRTVLDKILVDAAVESGAELREGFSVDALTYDDSRVRGVRGSESGRVVSEKCGIVIGADGMNSIVARAGARGALQDRAAADVHLLLLLERRQNRRTRILSA